RRFLCSAKSRLVYSESNPSLHPLWFAPREHAWPTETSVCPGQNNGPVREIREEERNPEMIRVALSRITKPLLTETPSTGNLRLRGQVIQSFFAAKRRKAEVKASKSNRENYSKDIHIIRLQSTISILAVGVVSSWSSTFINRLF